MPTKPFELLGNRAEKVMSVSTYLHTVTTCHNYSPGSPATGRLCKPALNSKALLGLQKDALEFESSVFFVPPDLYTGHAVLRLLYGP